jgi:hypothetical protein
MPRTPIIGLQTKESNEMNDTQRWNNVDKAEAALEYLYTMEPSSVASLPEYILARDALMNLSITLEHFTLVTDDEEVQS